MDKIGSPGVTTLIAGGLLFIVIILFIQRYLITRRKASLLLALVSPGWFFLVAVLNGDVTRDAFNALRWIALGISLFLIFSLNRSNRWEEYKRTHNTRLYPPELDRRRQSRRAEDRRAPS